MTTSLIFMGTPDFAVPLLEALAQHPDYEVLAVVTQPDRPVGRRHRLTPSPVKKAALTLNLPILQPDKLSGSAEADRIIELKPDLIITAAFGQFLPRSILAAPRIAPINVHGSLLPKYRGGSPVQTAILNGETETGITIMEMAMKMDAGPIISQARIPITDADTNGTLFAKLSNLARQLLLETLPSIIEGTANRIEQAEDQVSFAYNIQPEEEELKFNRTATQLDCQVRALMPDPVAHLWFQDRRIKVGKVHPVSATTTLPEGTVVAYDKKKLWLAAGQQTVLALDEVQPAGKKMMPIGAFLNGIKPLVIGEQVIYHE